MIRKATLPRIAGAIWIAGLTLALAPIRAPVEDWYVITIAGSPAGSVRNLATEEGAEHVETQSFQLVLNRMGSLTEMASETTTRENRDGELLAVDMELDMSSQVTTLRAVVEPGRILIADGAGEASFGREITYEGRLVGPEGVRGPRRPAPAGARRPGPGRARSRRCRAP